MPSTYTNLGIEKIGTGEQSGVWGTTTNTNFDILDNAVSGVAAVTLTGDVTLSLSDGSTTDAGNFVLKFTSSLSSSVTVTIGPNDTEKVYVIQNATTHDVVISQGSGTNVTVGASTFKLIYCDGGGSGANVVDISLGNPGGFVWESIVTSATTMASGRGYFVNTASSAITMTLPGSPSLGDIIRIIDLGSANTNNITVARNSEKIMGSAADMTIDTNNAGLGLVYTDSTFGWRLLEV